MDLKEYAQNFLQLCARGEVTRAFSTYVDEASFIHHNPYFRSDAESLKNGMQENANRNPDKSFEILRSLADKDLVATHSQVKFNPQHAGIAVVHIMRFQNGKIVEMWDIGQAMPEDVVNERGMF